MTEALGYGSFLMLLAILALLQQHKSDVTRRLSVLEQRLDKVLGHLGIPTESPVPPEVAGLLQAGRKIEAVQVYRQATGASLKEAKDAIDRVESKRIIVP
jgi:hypothetical protein